MKCLTFLDYTSLHAAGKSVEAKLVNRTKSFEDKRVIIPFDTPDFDMQNTGGIWTTWNGGGLLNE